MRAWTILAVVIGIGSIVIATTATATTWHIDPLGTGDAPTIAAGVDSAAVGDTVEVACGDYFEDEIYLKSGVVVRSATGDPDCVTIDPPTSGAIACYSVDDTASLEGFTLTGGTRGYNAGTLFLDDSSLRIRRCRFHGNTAGLYGGAVLADNGGHPLFEDCVFFDNTGSAGGGALGLGYYGAASATLSRCTVYGNVGYGTFRLANGSQLFLENTIVASNQGPAVVGSGTATASCSDVWSNTGGDWINALGGQLGVNGNFSADPVFCDAGSGDFTLNGLSPCLPGRHPDGAPCGLIGAEEAGCGSVIAAVPPGPCITPSNPCLTVPVNITRDDVELMRAFSVTLTISPELQLCGPGAIAEGTYLSSVSGATTFFQVVDNSGGSYSVDGAILGLPCGQTDANGTLFTIDVQGSGEAVGTITIDSAVLRDCSNTPMGALPGDPATVVVDMVLPAAVVDLAASQALTGNAADTDTTRIQLDFTAPGDAAVTEVWAAPFGDYPEYDDGPGPGSVPAAPSYPPGAPWQLTTATGTGQSVTFADRDFWYFVVFTKDECGNVSPISNMTTGTLNYHLGDVTDGSVNGHGDNEVDIADISHLGDHYGTTLTIPDPLGYLDVGPTTDLSVNALPTTDQKVDFEDLLMFAINFGQVSGPRGAPAVPSEEIARMDPAISLDVVEQGQLVVARLSLVDNADHVKGIHAFVSLGGLVVESAEPGALVPAQPVPVFFETVAEGAGIWVDLAALGREAAFQGDGEIAVLTLGGTGTPSLGEVILRDRANRPASRRPVDIVPAGDPATASGPAVLPSRIELVGARPNPFDASTDIVFRLPASAPVSLTVHDVTGRLVRTLIDRPVAAGETSVRWDGRTNDGRFTGAGIYFYTFRTGDHRETRKVLRVN
jgi:hypothetical protein